MISVSHPFVLLAEHAETVARPIDGRTLLYWASYLVAAALFILSLKSTLR